MRALCIFGVTKLPHPHPLPKEREHFPALTRHSLMFRRFQCRNALQGDRVTNCPLPWGEGWGEGLGTSE